MVSINTDMMNLIMQRNLGKASYGLQSVLERMSTGLRVNSAKDDVAGYSVASNLNTQIRGLRIANENMQMGVSMLGVAEGSMATILNSLYRMRDLTLQAGSETYGNSAKTAMQTELDARLDEITRLKNTTNFNGVPLFGTKTILDKTQTYTDNPTAVTTSAPSPYSALTYSELLNVKAGRSSAVSGAVDKPRVSGLVSTPVMGPMAVSGEVTVVTKSSGSIDINANSSKTFEFFGKTYTFDNTHTGTLSLTYSYNKSTDELTFGGNMLDNGRLSMTSKSGQDDNLIIDTYYLKVNLSDGDNKVNVVRSYNTINAGSGTNDIVAAQDFQVINLFSGVNKVSSSKASIVVNASGGANTIYFANASSSGLYLTGGNNTVNVGSYSSVFSDGGLNNIATAGTNVYMEDLTNNATITINGGLNHNIIGAGNTTLIKNAGLLTANSGCNVADVAMVNDGVMGARVGQTKTYNLIFSDGTTKSYDVKMTNAYGVADYRYNATSKDLFLRSSNFSHITSAAGQDNNVVLISGMFFNGGNGNNVVQMAAPSQTVILGDGNNKVTSTGANHSSTLTVGNGTNNIDLQSTVSFAGTPHFTVNTGSGANTLKLNSDKLVYKINSGGNDHIIVESGVQTIIDVKGTVGNTYNITGGNETLILSNSGNNTYNITSGALGVTIQGRGGVDTINNSGALINTFNIAGQPDQINSAVGTIHLDYNSDPNAFKTINLFGKEYYIRCTSSAAAYSELSWNVKADGQITFSGTFVQIKSKDGQDNNIKIKGNSNVYNGSSGVDNVVLAGASNTLNMGAGDDTVVLESGFNNTVNLDSGSNTITINSSSNTVRGGNGNDTIHVNATNNKVYGEAGDDIINVNVQMDVNSIIDGGAGDDIINIKSSNNLGIITGADGNDTLNVIGSHNTIFGGAGDDVFNNLGDRNVLHGEAGYNILKGNGTNVSFSNINRIELFKNIGTVHLAANSSMEYSFGGKIYIIKNTAATATSFDYSFAGGEVEIKANKLEITSADEQKNNIKIIGNENTLHTKNLKDTVKIQGNNNIINTNGGDDSILVEGNGNKFDAGNGNDTINVISGNKNEINGGTGYDITINMGQNTTIKNMNELHKPGEPFRLQVGTDGTADSAIYVDTGFMMSFFDLDIMSVENAMSALKDIDEMISLIISKMTGIGANKNRLTSAMEYNTIVQTNLISAQSSIVDADLASEASKMINYQILQQASQNLMMQSSRLRKNNILSLLNFR